MKRLLILCVSIMFLSCEPATKEAYLKHYAEFMNKVTTEASNYTEADWARADEEFSQLSVTWYEQFESELSFAEELKLAGYQAKYAFYRGVSGVGPVLKEVMDSSDEIIQGVDAEVSDAINHIKKEIEKNGGSVKDMEKYLIELSGQLEHMEETLGEEYQSVIEALEKQLQQ